VARSRKVVDVQVAKRNGNASAVISDQCERTTLAITNAGQSKFVKPRLPVGSVVMAGVRVILGKLIMWWLGIPYRCCCRRTDPATPNDLINAKIKNNY